MCWVYVTYHFSNTKHSLIIYLHLHNKYIFTPMSIHFHPKRIHVHVPIIKQTPLPMCDLFSDDKVKLVNQQRKI